MNMLDVDAIRAQVRALDFTSGTPADAAMRREDDADARANLAIEGMALDAGEHALFDMMREEDARWTATNTANRSARWEERRLGKEGVSRSRSQGTRKP